MNELELLQKAQAWDTFRIEAPPERLNRLLEELDHSLPEGWVRDVDAEKRIGQFVPPQGGRCYRFMHPDRLTGVSLWLVRPAPGVLKGGQYVPLGQSTDAWPDSMRAVIWFYERLLLPITQRLGLLVGPVHPVERAFTAESLALLNRFCDVVQGDGTELSPAGTRAWNQFLTTAHRSGQLAELADFQDWLVSRRGFPSERAAEFAEQYDRGLSLLESYDAELIPQCR